MARRNRPPLVLALLLAACCSPSVASRGHTPQEKWELRNIGSIKKLNVTHPVYYGDPPPAPPFHPFVARHLEEAFGSDDILLRVAKARKAAYARAEPYPHAVVDDLFPRAVIHALTSEIRENSGWDSPDACLSGKLPNMSITRWLFAARLKPSTSRTGFLHIYICLFACSLGS